MSTETAVAASSSRGLPAEVANLSAVDQSQAQGVTSSPLPVLAKRKPRWSTKPPKDSRVYKIACGAVALRAQGLRGEEITEALGVTYNTWRTYLRKAIQRGWLTMSSFDEPEDKVELVLVDKAIRNANEMLDDRDKDMTIETLKGTGVFKQHQAVKVENQTNVGLALKVQIEMPPLPAGALPMVRSGSVGGAHGVNIPVDAEIVELKEGA